MLLTTITVKRCGSGPPVYIIHSVYCFKDRGSGSDTHVYMVTMVGSGSDTHVYMGAMVTMVTVYRPASPLCDVSKHTLCYHCVLCPSIHYATSVCCDIAWKRILRDTPACAHHTHTSLGKHTERTHNTTPWAQALLRTQGTQSGQSDAYRATLHVCVLVLMQSPLHVSGDGGDGGDGVAGPGETPNQKE